MNAGGVPGNLPPIQPPAGLNAPVPGQQPPGPIDPNQPDPPLPGAGKVKKSLGEHVNEALHTGFSSIMENKVRSAGFGLTAVGLGMVLFACLLGGPLAFCVIGPILIGGGLVFVITGPVFEPAATQLLGLILEKFMPQEEPQRKPRPQVPQQQPAVQQQQQAAQQAANNPHLNPQDPQAAAIPQANAQALAAQAAQHGLNP